MKYYSYSTVVKITLIAFGLLACLIYMSGRGHADASPIGQTTPIEVVDYTPPPKTLLKKRPAFKDYVIKVSNREARCLAETVYGEASDQNESAQIRVAEVAVNRYLSIYWDGDLCDVVTYKRGNTYHFTMYDPRDPNLVRTKLAFSDENIMHPATLNAIWIADQVLMHGVRYLPPDSYNYAHHTVSNRWTRKLAFVVRDGDHVFRRGH